MSLSQQAIDVLTTVVSNENQKAKSKYADDLRVYMTVTEPNWVSANVQSRNLVSNLNFTPTPIPSPPQLLVYSLNNDTGEITSSYNPPDPSIAAPVLPPYISGAGNGFASLQPTLSSAEMDLNTVNLTTILAAVTKLLNFFGIK